MKIHTQERDGHRWEHAGILTGDVRCGRCGTSFKDWVGSPQLCDDGKPREEDGVTVIGPRS